MPCTIAIMHPRDRLTRHPVSINRLGMFICTLLTILTSRKARDDSGTSPLDRGVPSLRRLKLPKAEVTDECRYIQ